MQRQGKGSIINTASFVATMGAATSQISYTASKGGVLAMSRELGVQFAREGIRVNALSPGPVNTPLLQRAVREGSGARRAPPRAHPLRPLRRAERDRRGRGVPRQRRLVVHHREQLPRRRRHLGRLRHAAVALAVRRPAPEPVRGTSVRRAWEGDAVTRIDLDQRWMIMGHLNGGYLAAVMGDAASGALDGAPPLTISTHFLAPARGGGPADVDVAVLRRGRLSTARVTLSRDEQRARGGHRDGGRRATRRRDARARSRSGHRGVGRLRRLRRGRWPETGWTCCASSSFASSPVPARRSAGAPRSTARPCAAGWPIATAARPTCSSRWPPGTRCHRRRGRRTCGARCRP